MNNLFYDQMFNPQYVNQSNYHALIQQRYENEQNEEVAKVVKAFHDLCEAASNWILNINRLLFKLASLNSL